MSFQNSITIISGASSGIGKATRDLLNKEGSKVYNLDHIAPGDNDPHFILCDVSDHNQVEKAVESIYKKEKRIDYLFTNAGRHLFANIEETNYEQLHALVNINILGTFYLLKNVIPVMKQGQKGSIVIMGSDQAFIGKANSSVYGMTKGAVAQLTKSTAIDYARYNIRVNCICPGTIQTPLLDNAVQQVLSKSPQESSAVYASLDAAQPLGRIGRPEEIASTVRFLFSDDSSFITGALIAADGGYTCQ